MKTQTVHDLEAAFRRGLSRLKTPHQSSGVNVSYPGITVAAKDLGVSRAHLHRVLVGDRQSAGLMSRWHAWLKRNPQFAALQPRR